MCDAYGWESLYNIVKTYAPKCRREGYTFLIMTKYAGKYISDGKGKYEVIARCGWRETLKEYSFAICGLTIEQVIFLDCVRPKEKAILCVGKIWTTIEDAINKALECGCKLTKNYEIILRKYKKRL
ncbi:MAG: hypothetical protein Q6363_008510 [Candidatus Njordarchaeota archaeon]